MNIYCFQVPPGKAISAEDLASVDRPPHDMTAEESDNEEAIEDEKRIHSAEYTGLTSKAPTNIEGCYLAVKVESERGKGKVFMAKCLGLNEADNSKIDVKFLKEYGARAIANVFVWPDKVDISAISKEQVVGYVQEMPETLRRGELKFFVDANQWN